MRRTFQILVYMLLGIPVNAQIDSLLGPIDKNATTETRNLLLNLKKFRSLGIMFGHQDDLLYGHGWKYENGRSDVKSVCGDYPAVYGWEIREVEIGNTCNLDSVPFAEIKKGIKDAYARGGINTISWHANNIATDGNAWDTTKVVYTLLPGGQNHEKFKHYLDKLSAFLLDLKDGNGKMIPLLFRPYHENSGKWFWWGGGHCTAEEYKELFHFTVNYLCKVKGVHNLLFTYSPDRVKTKQQYLSTYPGDNYVDIFGTDVYCWNKPGGMDEFINAVNTNLTIVTEAAKEKHKLAAFTETGLERIPNNKWWTEVLWKTIEKYPISYVLVWRNAYNRATHYYAPFPGHQSSSDFVEFYKLPGTLFQKEVAKAGFYK